MRAIKVHLAVRRGLARRLTRRHDFDSHCLWRNGLHSARADIGQAQQQGHVADRRQSKSVSGKPLPSDHEDRAQPLAVSARTPTPDCTATLSFLLPAGEGRPRLVVQRKATFLPRLTFDLSEPTID